METVNGKHLADNTMMEWGQVVRHPGKSELGEFVVDTPVSWGQPSTGRECWFEI